MTPRVKPGWLLLVTLLSLGSLHAQALHHHVSWKLGNESASVTVTITELDGETITLWRTPVPNQNGFELRANAGETQLPVEESFRGFWTIPIGGATTITVRYAIPLVGRKIRGGLGQRYPHKFQKDGEPATVRYHRAFALRGETWVYLRTDAAQRVTFDLPPGLEATGALPRASDGSFACATYPVLADSPFYIGHFKTLAFQAGGSKHRVVLSGFDRDRTDRNGFTDLLTKLIASNVHSMGPRPTRGAYTFFFGNRPDAPTATGHRSSAEVITHSLERSPVLLRDLARAHRIAFVDPHFHPAGGGRVTAPSQDTWFVLGSAEYQTELILVRAGLLDAEEFFTRKVATYINTLQRDQRRGSISVAETGEWMISEATRRRPPGPHPRIRGFLLCLLLDIEIRASTSGKKSLDDVIRDLASECRRQGQGFGRDAIQKACERVAGRDFAAFFGSYVTGTDELPLQSALKKIGIDTEIPAPPVQSDPNHRSKSKPPPRHRARWRISISPKPGDAALQLRDGITKVVVR